ncbi:transketolase [Gehongia tenuis]|uniref:Transketolase n=1 Tax=Gehongia tenuis TaxID=2763655 RepID=A0A926D2Z1_9FIRM|nr:transketolase [Gehongia tenuis]MBC8531445.1 transketolase [Gehongia tenuis]
MKPIEELTVNAIRVLSAQAVQKANSGHPGMPLGAAPMAYALYGKTMNYNPRNPYWHNRDRFVLSAGHGSMLLYSALHLFGYDLDMEDIKDFRQLGSKTPGHPEIQHTPGVEVSTGPLGQGIANAVGMALAERHLAARFNKPDMPLVDHYTYVIAGDGCMMEGISGEAASLAGTWGLGKLIVLYDSNAISIEGSTEIAFTESVADRFRAYNWQVLDVADGNDVDAIEKAIEAAKADAGHPTLIEVHTKIGYGSSKEGSAASHGAPLGEDSVKGLMEKLNWPCKEWFEVPGEVYDFTRQAVAAGQNKQDAWDELAAAYQKIYPEEFQQYQDFMSGKVDASCIAKLDMNKPMATRQASGMVIAELSKAIPNLMGGSADLGPSNLTSLPDCGDFSKANPAGRNMHFGVREHAMAAIANGMALHGGLRVFCATFFVFSDYMKHAMRMSALMNLPVVYVLTHDSLGVGEDGPTHEPIEQLAALRSIPNLTVFRPADGKETAAAWQCALSSQGPTALVLSRQGLPCYERSGADAAKGGYILSDCQKAVPDVILMATGSEVALAMEAQKILEGQNVAARVVSMPSFERFDAQNEAYRESVLPSACRARVAIEVLSSFGWYKYVGLDGAVIAMDRFGASGPANDLFKYFGFTAEHVVEETFKVLDRNI